MSRVIEPMKDIRAFRQLWRFLKQENFDVVQYATPKAALLGSIASWLVKVPVRLYLMWGLYYVGQSGGRKTLFKFIEKIVCRLSSHIAPDSYGNCRFAVEEGLCKPGKIAVVHHGSANGVDTERYHPQKLEKERVEIRRALGIPGQAKLFGSITPLVGDKGVNELVFAFAQLAEKYPHIYLLLVGETAQKDPVTPGCLAMLQGHPRIRNVAWQKDPEKYLAAMDIFVLPTYREGFGVVNIEASSMELPVITTDVPGPREAIVDQQTGLLIPPRAVKPLRQAMKRLLDHPEMAQQLGRAGRQRVKEFYEQRDLWEAIVEHRKNLLRMVPSGN